MDKALICAALGLPADATDEQINAAAAEMSKLAGDKPPPAADEETKAKLSEATVKLAEKDAVVLKLAEENKTLGAENKSLGARVLSLEDAQKKGAADAYVAELVRAGKIAPAQHAGVKALALSDLALAKSIYDNAPVVVKLGESGVPGTTGPADEAKAAEAKLDARVAELRKADPALKFSEAHRLALSESPDLARIYAAKP